MRAHHDLQRRLALCRRCACVRLMGVVLLGVLSFTLITALPATAQVVVYENDFEDPNDPLNEWSNPATDITPVGARRFLGQFDNENISLTLADLPPHTSVTVSFDLFIIDSWDGNGDCCAGPDIWELRVSGGATLLHTTFSNTEDAGNRQAYPDAYPGGDHPARTGVTENNTLGYSFFGDSVYRLSFTFPHSAGALVLNFAGIGLQGIGDESWGLDNVQVSVTPGTLIPVTNTADSGPGSLCQAILDANSSDETASAIVFNIPTTDPGFDGRVFTIRPTTPLPIIQRSTVIDGSSQTASTGDSNPLGPEVVLTGSQVEDGSGITIIGDGSTVIGLVVNEFASGDGIRIGVGAEGDSTPSHHRILNNYIGTDPTGTIAVPNADGVSVHGFRSPDLQARDNIIQSNLIAGNTRWGISLCEAAETRITDNRLGTDRGGTGDLGNGSHGINLGCAGAPRTRITQNTIAFNGGDGVRIAPDYHFEVASTPDGHQGNTIQRNAIFANGGLGINLIPPPVGTEDGVTPNDPCDPDEGANRLQNFPELILAVSDGGSTMLSGTLNSRPNETFTVEFFANAVADPSGFGEGQRLVGAIPVTTDAACTARFTLALPGGLTGQFLTATATDAAGNTSEFSIAREVLPLVNDLVSFDPLPATFTFTPDPTGCPEGFVGKFLFEARLTDISESSLTDLVVVVTTLTHDNLLQNADGGPEGVGARLTVPQQDGFTDGVLSPEEFVDVPFVMCLTQRQPFTFVVDVLGEVK